MVKYTEKRVISDVRSEYYDGMTFTEFIETVEYSSTVIMDRFGSWAQLKYESGLDEDSIVCPNCDTRYNYISNHWNKCGEPELSEYKKSLLKGMLLSDGTVNSSGGFTAYSSNREFIEWFSGELEFMAYPSILNDSGDDRHKRNMKSGFDTRKNVEYKDVYAVSIPKHSFTEQLRKWYKSGEKKIPDDLSADKTLVKMWYCCDGGLHWSGNNAYTEIRPLSFDNDAVKDILDQLSFNYSIQSDGTTCFYGDTENFLEYLGTAPSGMEYKWETKSRERYKRLKPY